MGGFLERLRRQKEAAIRGEYFTPEEIKTYHESKMREEQERERRYQLEKQALSNSVVPQLASQLQKIINGGEAQDFSEKGGFEIRVSGSSFDWEEYITIRGNTNGSVSIGTTNLSRWDKNNPQKVERALEKAYKNPEYRDNSPA